MVVAKGLPAVTGGTQYPFTALVKTANANPVTYYVGMNLRLANYRPS